MKDDAKKTTHTNRDPITGEPGSHPLGTGVGAASGAAIGAAAGLPGGPVGLVAGIAVGAIAGGYTGKGVAEDFNPTEEDAFWRENHLRQSFAAGRPFEDYRDAYRVGYEGFERYRFTDSRFDDVEAELQSQYQGSEFGGELSWIEAREAARAAWNRLAGNLPRIIGYVVQDSAGNDVGKVQNLWANEHGQPVFLGVKTGWLFGRNHVVPANLAKIGDARRVVRLPYTEEQIKRAPTFGDTVDLTEDDQIKIFSHYGTTGLPSWKEDVPGAAGFDETTKPAVSEAMTPSNTSARLRRIDSAGGNAGDPKKSGENWDAPSATSGP